MFHINSYWFMSTVTDLCQQRLQPPPTEQQRYRVSEIWPIETSHSHLRNTRFISSLRTLKWIELKMVKLWYNFISTVIPLGQPLLFNNNSYKFISTVKRLCENCILHFNSKCFTSNSYWFMSTVTDLCQQRLHPPPPSSKDTESAKHDPLKLVTLIYETQDGAIADLVPNKISLCREIVFPTEMWARLVLQQCQNWLKKCFISRDNFYDNS